MFENLRLLPAHFTRPPPEPDLQDLDDVARFLLPCPWEWFAQLPRDEPFFGLARAKYELRTRQIIEQVRPSCYRLTPFGRFLQDHIKARLSECDSRA